MASKQAGATAAAAPTTVKKTAKGPVVAIWNKARVLLIHGPINVQGRKQTKVHRINPGTNEIKADVWDGLKDLKRVREHLNKGDLRVLVTDTGATVEKIPDNLSSLNEAEAVTMVQNTMEESQLQVWEKRENRKSVKEAIKIQLESLKAATPEKE